MDQLNILHGHFNRTITALVTARRTEAVALAADLELTKQQLIESAANAEHVRQVLREEQANTAAKDELIARLQAVIAGIL